MKGVKLKKKIGRETGKEVLMYIKNWFKPVFLLFLA